MKKTLMKLAVVLLCMTCSVPAMAQFNLKKAVGGAVKAAKAVTLTDEQMREYVKEYIDWMDKHNQVCADDDPYTVRLKKLTEGLNEVEDEIKKASDDDTKGKSASNPADK